jgi:hypothetical protein
MTTLSQENAFAANDRNGMIVRQLEEAGLIVVELKYW